MKKYAQKGLSHLSWRGLVGVACAVVISAALLISLLVLSLTFLLFLAQLGADWLGYTLAIPDTVKAAVLTVIGAGCVGTLALYGVHRQNMSAEQRHKVDSSLTLRKEIFLQFADAASAQYQYLLSFATPNVTEADRRNMIDKNGAAFARLQLVASQEAIAAMLESNVAWSRAMHKIRSLGPVENGVYGSLDRLIEIQVVATPFMRKVWEFNIVARGEIDCDIRDANDYLQKMSEKFSELEKFLRELRGVEKNRISDRVLDYWVMKQLRGAVLSDLADFIEPGYFESEQEQFLFNENIKNSKYLSNEVRWGYLAGKLGRRLYFESAVPMSARQVAASEVLMHLGMLASIAASMTVCTNIGLDAAAIGVPDGNSSVVAQHLKNEQLPILTENLLEGLKQYMLHLSKEEAAPFNSLLDNSTPISIREIF